MSTQSTVFLHVSGLFDPNCANAAFFGWVALNDRGQQQGQGAGEVDHLEDIDQHTADYAALLYAVETFSRRGHRGFVVRSDNPALVAALHAADPPAGEVLSGWWYEVRHLLERSAAQVVLVERDENLAALDLADNVRVNYMTGQARQQTQAARCINEWAHQWPAVRAELEEIWATLQKHTTADEQNPLNPEMVRHLDQLFNDLDEVLRLYDRIEDRVTSSIAEGPLTPK